MQSSSRALLFATRVTPCLAQKSMSGNPAKKFESPPAAEASQGAAWVQHASKLSALIAQLGLLLWVVHQFQIGGSLFLLILMLAVAGFVVRFALPQRFLIDLPIQVSEPVVLVPGGLVCYVLQEGWPVVPRRSCGTGCLCRLRCCVGSFARFGAAALLRVTMNQSDSLITRGCFLSLLSPSRLALVVSAAGALRASQVLICSFFTCHAL